MVARAGRKHSRRSTSYLRAFLRHLRGPITRVSERRLGRRNIIALATVPPTGRWERRHSEEQSRVSGEATTRRDSYEGSVGGSW